MSEHTGVSLEIGRRWSATGTGARGCDMATAGHLPICLGVSGDVMSEHTWVVAGNGAERGSTRTRIRGGGHGDGPTSGRGHTLRHRLQHQGLCRRHHGQPHGQLAGRQTVIVLV